MDAGMARHARIRVSGGWYHVFTRGHNREQIFCCETDCEHFLELIGEMREQFRVRVIAYCGMKLGELASKVGGVRDSAVTGAVKHLESLSRGHREIRQKYFRATMALA